LTGLSWPVLKGLLETSLEGRTAALPTLLSDCFSRLASGGSGGRCSVLPLPLLLGLGRGGRLGGSGGAASVTGDILLTVAAEAVEDRESLEEVRLIFEGLSGDRLVSRSSVEELLLTVILLSLEAMTLTLMLAEEAGAARWTGADTAALIMFRSSSWELDLTRGGGEPN